jgi:hypothetical protein
MLWPLVLEKQCTPHLKKILEKSKFRSVHVYRGLILSYWKLTYKGLILFYWELTYKGLILSYWELTYKGLILFY